jgi:hypothetical protein
MKIRPDVPRAEIVTGSLMEDNRFRSALRFGLLEREGCPVEGFVPSNRLPVTASSGTPAAQRVSQAIGGVEYIQDSPSLGAEGAEALGMVGVTFHSDGTALLDGYDHPAAAKAAEFADGFDSLQSAEDSFPAAPSS